MWRQSIVMAMALVLALGSGIVMAAQDDAAKPSKKPASAKGFMNGPQLVSGEVVSVTPGKSVQVKESTGKVRNYGLSKKTVIDGELKVGRMISVTSAGRWAQQITVQPAKDRPELAQQK